MSGKSVKESHVRLVTRQDIESSTARIGDVIAVKNQGDGTQSYVPAIILHYINHPAKDNLEVIDSHVQILPIHGSDRGKIIKLAANLGPGGTGAAFVVKPEDQSGGTAPTSEIFGEASEIYSNGMQKISEQLQATIKDMILNERLAFSTRDDLISGKALPGTIVAIKDADGYVPAMYLGNNHNERSGTYTIVPVLGRNAGKTIEVPVLSISRTTQILGPSLTKLFLSVAKSK